MFKADWPSGNAPPTRVRRLISRRRRSRTTLYDIVAECPGWDWPRGVPELDNEITREVLGLDLAASLLASKAKQLGFIVTP
jgi:hypothetical protein